MNILTSLGVDWTLGVHVLSFLVSYLALTQLIFKPYLRAHHEREARTVGNEDMATRVIQEAGDLQTKFEEKAKAINYQIKATFDASRSEALREQDRLVHAAREQASEILQSSRKALAVQIQTAKKELTAEIPAVSAAIASRLVGKDLSA